MNDVVKWLRLLFTVFTAVSVVIIGQIPVFAQETGFTRVEACAGLPSAAPSAPFDGLLVTVDSDAVRAFRSGVATTYVLSFGGGNFLSAGAVSPDGKYYAVPNGIISTITTSDVRYVVQEIRILTTETVPRIIKRLPWRASFPMGTRFSTGGDIPPIRWLDGATIQFVSGTMSEGQSPVQAGIFDNSEPAPTTGYGFSGVSPDETRAFALIGGRLVLIDAATGETIAALPQTPDGALQAAWSPDSAQFVMTDVADGAMSLRLYGIDGGLRDTLVTLPAEQVLWNVRWSPDGARIAYTAFDPQPIVNRLHIIDLAARRVTDTCLPLLADVNGSPLSVLAWSPDSTRLAVMTKQAAPAPQVQIYSVTGGTRYNLIAAAGRLAGWYP